MVDHVMCLGFAFCCNSLILVAIPTFILISGVFGANSSEAKSALVLLFAFLHFCTNETIIITEDVFFESVNPINGRGGVYSGDVNETTSLPMFFKDFRSIDIRRFICN